MIEEECDFRFNMIYNLCFYDLSIQSSEEAVALNNLCKIIELRKQKLIIEILHDFKGFLK